MVPREFSKSIGRDLPVLFVNIGWAISYDGTENITGNHKYIKDHPGETVGESKAFIAGKDTSFRCGIGLGQVAHPLHIVFVARDPGDSILKTVGVYAAAVVSMTDENWAVARARHAERIAVEKRQPVKGWPGYQGMRRWARRSEKTEHQNLFALFEKLAKGLSSSDGLPDAPIGPGEGEDGHEGEIKKLLVRHRRRERRLRRKKITDAMVKNGGLLVL
jgi:hypothetical protein